MLYYHIFARLDVSPRMANYGPNMYGEGGVEFNVQHPIVLLIYVGYVNTEKGECGSSQ